MTYTLIEHRELTSSQASITLSSIPSTFTDLYLVISARSAGGTNWQIRIEPNSSTSNLTTRRLWGNGASAFSDTSSTEVWAGDINDTSTTANTFSSHSIYIPNYTSSNHKSFSNEGVTENNATTARQSIIAGLWQNTAAISSLRFTMFGDSFGSGTSLTLYGITAGSSGGVVVS